MLLLILTDKVCKDKFTHLGLDEKHENDAFKAKISNALTMIQDGIQREVQKIKGVKWNSSSEKKGNSGFNFLAIKASFETAAVNKR